MDGFSVQTITALVEVVTGGPGLGGGPPPIGIYRTASELEMFLGAVGLELHVAGSSRVRAVRDVLIANNKTSEGQEAIMRLIEQVADHREYLECPDKHSSVVSYLNARLKGDGYELQRVGEIYKLYPFSSQEPVASVPEERGEIPILSKASQPPSLKVTKLEAEEKIRQQIEKGKEIANIPTCGIESVLFNDEDLKHERIKFLNWVDFNTKLLKLLFIDDSIADEYYQRSYPEKFMDAKRVTEATNEFVIYVNGSITELEDIIKKLELVPESPEVSTHKHIAKKRIFTKNFIKNLLRASIRHLPFCGPFLYDVIYGTLDSQASQKEAMGQPKLPQSGAIFEKQKPVAKYKPDGEKSSQSILLKVAKITLVAAIITLVGAILTSPLWSPLINKICGDSGEIKKISTESKLPLSLKEICQDIDSRPLLQREETAKRYIGIKIERERLKLFDIHEYPEDGTFGLTMILPEESNESYLTGRKIFCTVEIEQYPQLNTAKKGLELYVSGQIKDAGSTYIKLSDVSLKFD